MEGYREEYILELFVRPCKYVDGTKKDMDLFYSIKFFAVSDELAKEGAERRIASENKRFNPIEAEVQGVVLLRSWDGFEVQRYCDYDFL